MRRVEKPWGHEEIWAETDAYVGKVLVIRAGHRLSLQHHEVKEETIRLASGRLRLLLEDDAGRLVEHLLEPGEARHIPPRRRHRMEALVDCEVYEVSTPHLHDVVRHVDDYGRGGGGEAPGGAVGGAGALTRTPESGTIRQSKPEREA